MSTKKFVDVFYREYSDVLTSNFRSFLDDEIYIDLVFQCRNNRKVNAHQIVLGFLSKFLYKIIIDNKNDTKEKIVYICVPDISCKIMKNILQFIYSGKTMLNTDQLNEFNENLLLLGMPSSSIVHVDEPSCSFIWKKIAHISQFRNGTDMVKIDNVRSMKLSSFNKFNNASNVTTTFPVGSASIKNNDNTNKANSGDPKLPVISDVITLSNDQRMLNGKHLDGSKNVKTVDFSKNDSELITSIARKVLLHLQTKFQNTSINSDDTKEVSIKTEMTFDTANQYLLNNNCIERSNILYSEIRKRKLEANNLSPIKRNHSQQQHPFSSVANDEKEIIILN